MSRIYRTHLIIAICLVLASSLIHPGYARPLVSADQGDGEWQRYTVSGEEFSVLLPLVPAMTTSDAYIDSRKSRRERILGAYSNGVVYAIYTFENKYLSLDDLIDRFAGRNQPVEPVTVDGVTGRSFRFDTDDRMGAVQLFSAGKNLYAFQVTGSKLGNPAAGIQKFLTSIKLSNQPEGTKVQDGPGEQPVAKTTQPAVSDQSVFTGKQVAVKASVITKPEPRYTREARWKSITGTVVLRAVFSSSGAVTNIHPVSELPDGLTDKAVAAAQQIRFIPAIKDGRFVSMWIQLEYNFNLF